MNLNIKTLNDDFERAAFRLSGNKRRKLWLKLGKMLNNGVPIVDALEAIKTNQTKGSPEITALSEWGKGLRNGNSFAVSLGQWVTSEEKMLIAAGEQSGELVSALTDTAKILEVSGKVRKAVWSGLAYPTLMLVLAFLMLIMFSYQTIPAFSGTIPPDKWKGAASFVVSLSTWTRDWLIFVLVAIFAILTGFILSLSRWTGADARGISRWRIYFDKFLPYSIYRMIQGGAWMTSLAALIKAGTRTESALEQLAKNAAPWLRVRVQSCLVGMRVGMNAGEALRKSGYGFPDREIINDLGVYAKLSGFDSALSIISNEWMAESVERIEGVMKVVFGVAMLFVGLFLAIMVGGLMDMQLQMATIMSSSRM